MIADPDSAFLEKVWADPQAQQVPPFVAQNGKEAQQVLAQYKQPFSGIFINPAVTDPAGISVVRAAHHYQPAVPIYFLVDEESAKLVDELTPQDLKALGVQKIVKKPISYAEVIKLVTPPTMVFNPDDALKVASQNQDPVESEVIVRDGSFFATRAENFLCGTRSFFDVYVRLDSGRYVKILRAGDSFAPERVLNYIQKGVDHFYLRTEAQEYYLNYCDKLVAAILKSTKVSTEIKVAQTMNHGQEMMEFLKAYGVTTSALEYASGFVSNLEVLVKQLELSKNETLKPFLEDLPSHDHGVGTAMIASLIGRALGISNEKAVQTVGLGSLLHDVGLYSLPERFRAEDVTLLSDADKRTYLLHPISGAKVLQHVAGFDPVVCQIVEQHHERRNRSGFPKQLGASAILQYSEVVGISDEFFQLIQRSRKDPSIDPTRMILFSSDGFSPAVISAFQKVFYQKA